MNQQECLDKMPKSIDDVSLGLYLSFNRELKGLKEADYNTIHGQMKLFRVVEMFVGVEEGEIDDLPLESMSELCNRVSELITQARDFKPSDHFTIGDITYSTRKIADMNSLTTGEYTTIKILQEQYKEEYDFIPMVMATLIRPAKLIVDDETKEGYWQQDKYNQRDVDNLKFRADLFREKALAKDLIPVMSFFLTGRE
jgi:hypothetical protein